MIIEHPSKRRSQNNSQASKVNITESAGTQTPRCKSPVKNSEALYRRAEELSRLVREEDPVDNEKVKRLKIAIAEGTYKVDADAIAAKLIEMEVCIARRGKQ